MSNRKRNIKYEETDEDFKYVCERGHYFNEPGYTREYEEHFGGRYGYEVSCCPICGGGYYDTKPWQRS